jgi:hypothetical protein
MTETKITKETKQEISVNYAINKLSTLRVSLIECANKLILEAKTATLKVNNTSESDLLDLIEQVNLFKNKNIRDNFYSSSFHISMIGNFPHEVGYMMHNVPLPNPRQGTLFYYCSNEKQDLYDKSIKTINLQNFNYSKFLKFNENDLYEDVKFKLIASEFNKIEEEYKELFNNSYINCYELIRNIRTLERIEKKFPDVNKYLPKEIKIKKDSSSIINEFDKL